MLTKASRRRAIIAAIIATIVGCGAIIALPHIDETGSDGPIHISTGGLHEDISRPPVTVDVGYAKVSGGKKHTRQQINADLYQPVKESANAYWFGVASTLGLTSRDRFSDRLVLMTLTPYLLSIRYEFTVSPAPSADFYWPSTTVTINLTTGQTVKASDVFLPPALTKTGLSDLTDLILDTAASEPVCSAFSSYAYTFTLTRDELDGENTGVDMAFQANSLDFILDLPKLGGYPKSCRESMVKIPYCVLSGIISPAFATQLGDRTAYPTPSTPVLGKMWATDQRGYGHPQPCVIFNGGDPTGLVTDIKWQSWGTPEAIASGIALYAPDIVADGKVEPARVVAFKLGKCNGVAAYTAVEVYFPQYGQSFDPHASIDACTTS